MEQQLKHNQKAVIRRLNLSPQKYQELVFETGLNYLDRYLQHNEPLINDFAKHRGFWNWWKIQYSIVDALFLRKYGKVQYDSDSLLIQVYIQLHIDIKRHIDPVVWKMIEESRDKMIHQLIKQTVR